MTANYKTLADNIDAFEQDVLHGEPPVLWDCGPALEGLEIGPGLLCIIGGAPGSGKTALAMQAVTDALRNEPDLRVLVANCEMTPKALLERQVARLGSMDLTPLRMRTFAGGERKVKAGLAALREVAPRLAFYEGPPLLGGVEKAAGGHEAQLVVTDYVQRFSAGDAPGEDSRREVDLVMDMLRRWCAKGAAVLAISAMARTKNRGNSSYEGLGLASFRGSSELEYACDSAWALGADPENFGLVSFQCVKNRHGATPGMTLEFLKSVQRFEALVP